MLGQMNSIKDKVVKYVKENRWTPELVALDITVKKDNHLIPYEVAVLCHDSKSSKENEFQGFLRAFAANYKHIEDKKFQIAAYINDKHWLAIHIEKNSSKLSFFVVADSALYESIKMNVFSVIRENFPSAIIYELKNVKNSTINDTLSCSRFTLHNLYALQKTDAVFSLAELKADINKNGIAELHLSDLPVELAEIIRQNQIISEHEIAKHLEQLLNRLHQIDDSEVEYILKNRCRNDIIINQSHYPDINPTPKSLYNSFKKDRILMISIHLACEIHVDTFDVNGESALTRAVKNNELELYEKMLAFDSVASIYSENQYGQSALFNAAYNNQSNIVESLLKFNVENYPGREDVLFSVLMAAAKHANKKMFALLREKFNHNLKELYDGKIAEFKGESVLSFAIKNGNIDVVDLISKESI